jgi:hypothetical protein
MKKWEGLKRRESKTIKCSIFDNSNFEKRGRTKRGDWKWCLS